MEQVIEKWMGKSGETVIGATKDNGGTRGNVVKLGGATTLPYLSFEGDTPNSPVVAMEVWDLEPADWPDVLKEPYKDVINDPAAWAKKCVEESKVDLICLRLASTDPDGKNTSAEEAAGTVKKVLEAVSVPLIIIGTGNAEKDAEIAPLCSEAAKGENCLMGLAVQENYKTMTAACQSGGHCIIAESPIDINLAKQLNILITDTGFPIEKIIMHHSTGALGYGLEYTYSIMERTKLAALQGDRMMSMPMMNMIGQEAWRAKEAKVSESEIPEWGPAAKRGPLWEIVTAMAYIQSGADLLVMKHPEAVRYIKDAISKLMKK